MTVKIRTNCPIASALDVVGERWSLLILRDLLLDGPRRFQDFADALTGVSPSTLSKRLKSLESHGVIERRIVEGHPPRTQYVLTPSGRDLKSVLEALHEWGQKRG